MTNLIDYISEDKRAKVEPLIDSVLRFYGPVDLSTSDGELSQFWRDINFETTPPKAKAKIVISETCNFETALVHELLHLALGFRHNVYALWFDPRKVTKDHGHFASLLQNVVEHDLMIDDFLSYGYAKKDFLKNSYNPIDYKKERLLNETDHYWLMEYFRLLINLKHIDEKDVEGCRKSLSEVRIIALNKFPGLAESFKRIREWKESRRFHLYNHYPQELQKLFLLFNALPPLRYLTPCSDNGELEQTDI
jgi:hypothetical protein